MWKTTFIAGLLLGLSPLAAADGINGSAVLGAGLGAAAGAAVGSAVGGRDGAVFGGAIGGAAGAAVGGNQEHRRPQRAVVVQPAYAPVPVYRGERDRYREHGDRGWHRGHWEHGRGWGPPRRDHHDD